MSTCWCTLEARSLAASCAARAFRRALLLASASLLAFRLLVLAAAAAWIEGEGGLGREAAVREPLTS